jgi:Rieske Fe-S protein
MRFDRRRFLDWFLGTFVGALCASVAYPVVRFISPPDVPESTANHVDAGSISDPELLEKGFKILRFGDEPVILIRAGEGDYRAYTATCTHLECIVEFRKAGRVIWCNCHNGVYDLNGRNVSGPPPRPLTPFAVHLVQREGQPAKLIVERT